MAKTEIIRSRIDPELKHDAEAVLSVLGLKTSEAITLFFKQLVLQRGLPFSVKIPNDVTIKALDELNEAKDKKMLPKFDSIDDLMADLKS